MIDHEKRKGRIGCSDLGVLFGVDPFRDQHELWVRVTGQGEEEPEDERQWLGHLLEPMILIWYEHATGYELEHFNETLVHDTLPLCGTPDALCQDHRRGVDAKNVHWSQRHLWADGPPWHIQLQMQGYMAFTNYEAWDCAAFIGGDPQIDTVYRDEPIIHGIEIEVEHWFRTYVTEGHEPPLGTSERTARWLQKRYPRHQRPDLREATPEEIALLDEYLDLRLELLAQKPMLTRRAELEVQLKRAIADREGLEWPGGKFTWRKTKGSQVTDWESMAIGLMQKFLGEEEREEWRNFHTRQVEGERRIRLDAPLMREAAANAKEEYATTES